MRRPPTAAQGLRLASAPGRWVVGAAVLGWGLTGIDATVVNIALPRIGRDFGIGMAGLQWTVTAYTMTLTGVLLLGGSLADRYGRRRLFVIGTVWFALASLLCGAAPSAPALILARALQGVGAALLTPASLAILQASFTDQDRARAIGAWSGLGGVATAVGPFIGGWLISAASWRWVFLVNLPVALAVVVISLRHVPESRAPTPGPLDLTGTLLVTVGLSALTFGLVEGAGRGWASPAILAALCGGGLALAAFLAFEARARRPLLPLRIFASPLFSATNAVTFVMYGALGAVLFLVPVTLQQASGYSPLASGAALLPVTAVMLTLSARSGALAARIGPRAQLTIGPVVAAAGIVLLARLGSRGDYLTEVLPATLVLGLGLAIVVAPLTATVLAALPEAQSGLASAVNSDVARAAGLVAVAVLPPLAGISGDSYLHPEQLLAGFRVAVWACAALCLAGGVLAVVMVRNPRRPCRTTGFHCAVGSPPLRPASEDRPEPPASRLHA